MKKIEKCPNVDSDSTLWLQIRKEKLVMYD